MKKFSCRTISAFLFIVGCSAPLAAQNVRTFVASFGVDSNPCSRTAPCRNFAAALALTSAEGEVVALDSGGYGPLTIGQSVSIVAPAGVHAAVAPTFGTAVTITAGSGDTVTLRGLYLNSQGALTGVSFEAGRTLHVENCVVSGFGSAGIRVERLEADLAEVFVRDSIVRDGEFNGILFRNATVGGQILGIVDNCQLVKNGFTVANAGNLIAAENSKIVVRDTIASRSTIGFIVRSQTADLAAELTLVGCISAHNSSIGLQASAFLFAQATMRVSNSTIVNNAFGVNTLGGAAVIESRGDNTLEGNPSANAFTSTYSAK